MAKRNPELEEAIARDPESVDGYLVYADWLQGEGDPRGELIYLDYELLQNPWGERAHQIRRQHRDLVDRYRRELLGSLHYVDESTMHLRWHLGFVTAVRPARVFSSQKRGIEILRAALGSPATVFLQELIIPPIQVSEDHSIVQPLLDVLCEKPRPTLRRLTLGAFAAVRELRFWPSIGEISRLCEVAPHLQELVLTGDEIDAAMLKLPELRALEARTVGLDDTSLRSLTLGELPQLERLSVWLGATSVTPAQLAQWFGTVPDTVDELGLCNLPFADDVVPSILAAGFAPRLRALDLRYGTLTDRGADALVRSAPRLREVETLRIDGNYIGALGLEALRGAFGARLIEGVQDAEYDVVPMIPERVRRVPAHMTRIHHARELRAQGRIDEAVAVLEQVLQLARLVHTPAEEDEILRELGRVLHQSGRLTQAAEVRTERLALAMQSRFGHAHAYLELGETRSAQGRLREADQLLRDAVAAAEEGVNQQIVGQCQVALAGNLVMMSRWHEARPYIEEALQIELRYHGMHHARALNVLGVIELNTGQASEAEEIFQRALRAPQADGYRTTILYNLAGAQWVLARYDDAVRTYQEVIDEAQHNGDRRAEGRARQSIGQLYLNTGRLKECESWLTDSLPLLREVEDHGAVGLATTHLGILYLQRRELDEARRCLTEALAIHRNVGNRQWEAIALGNLANIALDSGRLDEAQLGLTQSLEIHEELADRHGRQTRLSALGEVEWLRGQWEASRARYAAALEVSEELGDRRWSAYVRMCLARVDLCEHAYETAAQRLAEAHGQLAEIDDPQLLGESWALQGVLARARGDDASSAFERATESYERAGLEFGIQLVETLRTLTPEYDGDSLQVRALARAF